MTCSKALGALGLISVRGLDHPLTGNTFLCAKVDNIYKVTVIRDKIRNSSVVSTYSTPPLLCDSSFYTFSQ